MGGFPDSMWLSMFLDEFDLPVLTIETKKPISEKNTKNILFKYKELDVKMNDLTNLGF
jgi:hypothetical protein